MFQYFFSEELAVDVCVDFGGGNLLVSQHFLDGEQIGASFQQMGGERMAEGVRAYILFDSCQFRLLLDDMENHDP